MARTKLYPPSVDAAFPRLPPTPVGWRHATFRDVLEVVERPIRLEPESRYRLVTAKRNRGGITLRSELLGREVLTKTQFSAQAGDFLISRRQIIHGACGVVPQELDGAVVSNEYSTLRTRPELLMEFLQHYAHTPYFQRTCFHSSHGVDVEKMIFKLDEWLAREFDLPPTVEQKKIAAILASLDEAIEATQAVIDQLQVVKKALMAELLIRGLPGKHTRFKQTAIGEIPEEWRCEGIGQLAALGSGTTPSRTRPEYFSKTHGTAWVKTLDLNDHLVTTTQELVSEVALHETSLRVYPVGTVVVAMYGGFGQIGRSGVLGVPAATNQALCPILPRPDVSPLFLNHVLIGFRDRWRNIAASSRKDPNITKSDVANFAVPVPPLDEQREIAEVAEAHVTRLSVEGECLTALRQLRAALMSVLLTGEVRVKLDAERA